MIRNSKAFGLALVAMLALGAFVAQAASAVPLTVEGGGATTFFTGDQGTTGHVFKTPNGTVTCTSVSFSASATGTTINELTVTPSYESCTAFGFATAHVTENGCTYTFTTPSAIKAGEVKWSGSTESAKAQIHILCPTGKSIEITPTTFGISACTQFVGAQTPTGGDVIGKSVAAVPNHVSQEITLSGIHYTGTGGLCGNSETHSDATYTGNTTGKCYKNAAHTEQVGCKFS